MSVTGKEHRREEKRTRRAVIKLSLLGKANSHMVEAAQTWHYDKVNTMIAMKKTNDYKKIIMVHLLIINQHLVPKKLNFKFQ